MESGSRFSAVELSVGACCTGDCLVVEPGHDSGVLARKTDRLSFSLVLRSSMVTNFAMASSRRILCLNLESLTTRSGSVSSNPSADFSSMRNMKQGICRSRIELEYRKARERHIP